MLEELNSIDWSQLTHCYGSASDIPELLKTIAIKKDWEDALEKLGSRICHQGTLYEATAFVLPFLVQLLDEYRTHGELQDGILCLLKCICQGDTYLNNENAFKRNQWSQMGRDFDKDLTIQRGWKANIKAEAIRSITNYLERVDAQTPTALIMALLLVDLDILKVPLQAREVILKSANEPDLLAQAEEFFTCADDHMITLVQDALEKFETYSDYQDE